LDDPHTLPIFNKWCNTTLDEILDDKPDNEDQWTDEEDTPDKWGKGLPQFTDE
jgi:hypothetical protein